MRHRTHQTAINSARKAPNTFSQGKHSAAASPGVANSQRDIRVNNFRETLRKLLRVNENVFGKTQSYNEGIQLIREHEKVETNEVGRRVMRQRRVRIPAAIKSTYHSAWKNHVETAPHKIKPKLSMNLEQEHRKHPLRAVSSITADDTLYKHDFPD